jgi:flagellar basal-body rod protein FlgB
MTSMIDDPSYLAAKAALDGLSMRQQVTSRNIANVDTPGYQAQTVNFESAIKQAMEKTDKTDLTLTNAMHIPLESTTNTVMLTNQSGGTERADGNDVDIDNELTQMNETAIRYQAITQMVSLKFALIRNLVK